MEADDDDYQDTDNTLVSNQEDFLFNMDDLHTASKYKSSFHNSVFPALQFSWNK